MTLVYNGTNAQNHHATKEKINKIAQDTLTTVIQKSTDSAQINRVFGGQVPMAFNDPELPRFSLFGKEGKYYLGMGGYVKTSLAYDFDGAINDPINFVVSKIPVPSKPSNNKQVHFSAVTSNFFVNFVRFHGENRFSAYLNGNFTGPKNTFLIRYAYVTFNKWRAGFDISLFTDVDASVPTIDFQGPNAFTFTRNTTIAFRHSFNTHWSVGAATEMPIFNATYSSLTEETYQNLPSIPAYIKLSWDEQKSWVRLAGIIRSLKYRNNTDNEEKRIQGWGVQLSGKLSMIRKRVSLFYQGAGGSGFSRYLQDLSGLGLDFIPDPDSPGQLHAVDAFGGYAGLQYNFSEKNLVSCTYSQVRASLPAGTQMDDQYLYGQYLVANYFWNTRATIQLGIEYVYGRRVNRNGESNHANRVQASVQYNF
ncbi:DcaP family trimeric outer membrane transporter [Fulvitalea axinellae]|uniref:DcaP family trimeric outer membrane transporter n=1 Tax=Fulvitalea axinellae TaxID=1182444 RepID=UPI0030CA430E